jgi:rubrerythrin
MSKEKMNPVRALELALEKENESIKLYQDFIKKHPEVRDIFKMLLEEELRHKEFIEQKIAYLSKY